MSVNTAIGRLFLCCCTLSIIACNTESKQAKLTQKWKAVEIKNLTLEKEKAYYDILLDTITKNNERLEFFNGSIDSFKNFTRQAFEEQAALQQTQVDNSFMEFKENGVAYFTSISGEDSAKWSIEDNEIILDAEDFTGIPNLIRFGIMEHTPDELILRKVDMYDTNIIKLQPRK